jgi:hypothetical protein
MQKAIADAINYHSSRLMNNLNINDSIIADKNAIKPQTIVNSNPINKYFVFYHLLFSKSNQ